MEKYTNEQHIPEAPLSVKECTLDLTHNLKELDKLIDTIGNKIGRFSIEVTLPVAFEIPAEH